TSRSVRSGFGIRSRFQPGRLVLRGGLGGTLGTLGTLGTSGGRSSRGGQVWAGVGHPHRPTGLVPRTVLEIGRPDWHGTRQPSSQACASVECQKTPPEAIDQF